MPIWEAGLLLGALVALLVGGLAFLLHQRRLRAEQGRYAQLDAQMRERTQALAAAHQSASEAADANNLFLAHMSHEIRSPMNAIIGLAHLVQHADLSARQQDYIKKIERSGRHLMGVLNDMLDFSKLEAGTLRIESIAFELDTLLQEVVGTVAPMAYDKGLEFICVADPEVPMHLLGDPLRLTQILNNYLYHAVKQTAHGEVLLHVNCCAMPQDSEARTGMGLRFTVQDSGAGLSPEQCQHLFESYPLKHATPQRQPGATGVGLPVAKRLAGLMGGEVGVSSSPKRGSTLWFTAWLQVNPDPMPVGLQEQSVQGQKALVVDDHPIAAQTIAELLKRLGMRVDICHSGRDGLEHIRRAERDGDAYCVVLLDWEMPDWDGLQCARHIHSAGLAQPPGIIVVTGHSRDEIAKPAMAVGLSDILIKPVTASMLLETLLRAINRAGPRRVRGLASGAATARLENLRGAQILLVEDDDIHQEIACELLRVMGVAVDVASDGQLALQRMAHQRYDLVLMDMHMPVMDGITATRRLRLDPRNTDLPIIAMTANAMQSDRDRCLAAGMNGFLTKPIEPGQLEAALRQWIMLHPVSEDACK